MNSLRDMLYEFYDEIVPHLREPLISAINAVEENKEELVITPLSSLITLLANRYDYNQAVNNYMKNPATRLSSTRKFFFPHTLPGNLFPEDRDIYTPPPSPAIFPSLYQSHAMIQMDLSK